MNVSFRLPVCMPFRTPALRRYGWKQVHGDVFRPPRGSILLASFVGTGMQLAVVGICVIFISIWGDLWEGCVLSAMAGERSGEGGISMRLRTQWEYSPGGKGEGWGAGR